MRKAFYLIGELIAGALIFTLPVWGSWAYYILTGNMVQY